MDAAAASGGIERKPLPSPLENRPLPWLAPLLLLLGLFYLYPLIDVVRLSFTDITLMGGPYHYSLASFEDVFTSVDFAKMAGITVTFVIASVAGQWLLGLLIAVLLVA